jgi:hypothetical protein
MDAGGTDPAIPEVVESRPLTSEASAAGVACDAVLRLGMASAIAARPDHLTRLVVIKTAPREKRGGRKGKTAGPPSTGELLLATNLVEVPAEIIGLIYRYRWTIENSHSQCLSRRSLSRAA